MEKEKPNFDVATINPPFVFGPVIGYLNSLESLNTSNQIITDFALGKKKDDTSPKEQTLWVDVRDVALAHVKAIEVAEAGGKRFFTTEGFLSNKELVDTIREIQPKYASNLPDYGEVGNIPRPYEINNSRVRNLLGIEFKSIKESVGDTLASLAKVGL